MIGPGEADGIGPVRRERTTWPPSSVEFRDESSDSEAAWWELKKSNKDRKNRSLCSNFLKFKKYVTHFL
jgi:hypothetical protein